MGSFLILSAFLIVVFAANFYFFIWPYVRNVRYASDQNYADVGKSKPAEQSAQAKAEEQQLKLFFGEPKK